MLEFVTKPTQNMNNLVHQYQMKFYIKPDAVFTLANASDANKYWTQKLRDLLLDINSISPRLKQAKWYTPLPHMDNKSDPTSNLNKVSLINSPEDFIKEVQKENRDSELGLFIPHVWSGIHQEIVPAYFSYWHSFNQENIIFGDVLTLNFSVSYKFNLNDNWQQGFSLQELEEIIQTVNKHYHITHANLEDLDFRTRTVTDGEHNYYTDYYTIFPHRLGATWMTVLDSTISAKDLPEAAKVIHMNNNRSLVMSVSDDYFTSYNAEHVMRANSMELKLQKLGLLRAFDAVL